MESSVEDLPLQFVKRVKSSLVHINETFIKCMRNVKSRLEQTDKDLYCVTTWFQLSKHLFCPICAMFV